MSCPMSGMSGLSEKIKLFYGNTKTGKIHIFTNDNECLCDINIKIDKKVSKNYAKIKNNTCLNCVIVLKDFRENDFIII